MKWFIRVILLMLIGILSVIVWNAPAGKFNETLSVTITVSEPGQIEVHTTKEPQKLLNFGGTFPGTKVQKTINLTRGIEPPAKVHITKNGAIQNWTSIDKNDFIIDKPIQIEVTISIPDEAKKGTYTGNITIDYVNTYGLRVADSIHKYKTISFNNN